MFVGSIVLRLTILLPALLGLISASGSKIKMDVYYETLCPDSIRFIKKLFPLYDKIADLVELNLVPFGKASWEKNGDNYHFTCQHGPKECHGNMIHACNLALLPFREAFDFIHETESSLSLLRRPNVQEVMSDSAEKLKIEYEPIRNCAKGKQGQELLLDAGKKTKAVHPRITFIPTVVFNNQYSTENQRGALYGDLVELVKKLHKESNP